VVTTRTASLVAGRGYRLICRNGYLQLVAYCTSCFTPRLAPRHKGGEPCPPIASDLTETSRHFRNKKREYLKDKISTNSKNKNIRDLYRRINDFKRGYHLEVT
jgi:hypothetical protein